MKTGVLDTKIPVLGEAKIPSPIKRGLNDKEDHLFVRDAEKVVINVDLNDLVTMVKDGKNVPAFEMAGPRNKIYFDPSKLRCALVTCGGLCPGLNDIIRSIVLELHYGYGVNNIYGIRYGLQGFIPKYGHDYIDLKPGNVFLTDQGVAKILDFGIARAIRGVDDDRRSPHAVRRG